MTHQPLRILMIFNRYYPVIGGAEKQGRGLARALQQKGHDIRIVTRRLSKDLPAAEMIDAIPVRRLLPAGLSSLSNIIMTFRLSIFLIRHAGWADLLYVQGIGPIAVSALLASTLRNKPAILRISTTGDLQRGQNTAHRSVLSWLIHEVFLTPKRWYAMLARAAYIVVLNKQMLAQGREVLPHEKLVYIPNGIELTVTAHATKPDCLATRQRLGFNTDTTVLLWVGRLAPVKRLDQALQAVAHLKGDYPNLRLLVIGATKYQSPDYIQKLHSLLTYLNLENEVKFVFDSDDIMDYYQCSDILVFTSEREGMPNVLLEAMAAKLPIIATDIHGVNELVDSETAWLVKANSLESLVTSISEALQHPRLREQRTDSAFERVKRRQTYEVMVQQYEDLFHQVVNQHKDKNN